MSRTKELYFFIESRNWHRGVDWYSSQFDENAKIAGETSPGYTLYPRKKNVPEKIHSLIPDTKLIYIIRDPIERTKSSYMMNYAAGVENRPVDEALADLNNNPLIFPGMYFMQIQQYLPFFSQSQLLVVTLEDLRKDPQTTLQKIFSFLLVDDSFYSEEFIKIINPSKMRRRKNKIGMILRKISETKFAEVFPVEFRRKIGNIVYIPFSKKIQRPNFDQNLTEKLKIHFYDDVQQLRAFTGLRLEDWSL